MEGVQMPNRELGDVRFLGVPHDQIDLYWPKIRQRIEGAADTTNGRLGADDVYMLLKTRDWQLWLANSSKDGVVAVCTTEIIKYPKSTVCRICMGVGARYKEWALFRSNIEDWARQNGCDRIESIARKGWSRVFDDYQTTHVFLEKEL